jgi:hypothetical protein
MRIDLASIRTELSDKIRQFGKYLGGAISSLKQVNREVGEVKEQVDREVGEVKEQVGHGYVSLHVEYTG